MPVTTLLKKITSTRQYLPVLLCCLSLAACSGGGAGGVSAAGAVPAAPISVPAPAPTPIPTPPPGPLTLPVVNSAPTASAVTVTDSNGGSVVVGDTLVGSYTYADVDGDAQGVSTFRWLRNGVAISGAVAANYSIVAADTGATISFEVTPVAATGVIVGAAASSASVPVVNSAPTASAVTVTDPNGGSAVVGDTLVGSYTYADADGDIEGASTFRWLRNGTAIAGAAASTYTLVAADLGATISFEVTPVAATGVTTGLAVASTSGVTVTNVTNKITQFGITWTFAKSYTYGQTYGQFANGDYWVVGPATITSISPKSVVDTTGRTLNGSVINPSPRNGVRQGYDSALYLTAYTPSLNVGRPNQQDISSLNPLLVPVNSSLVSTISMPTPGARPQLKTAAILTVLGVAPPAGSFRPSYSGANKSIKFNKSQLNYALLKKLAPVASTPTLVSVERMFERPWLDEIPNWVDDYEHPKDNMPNYGRDLTSQVGIGALMLHLNFSNASKEKLLVRYVQLGIDLYGISQDGGNNNWIPAGGIFSGRKWPILFAGLLLNDAAMKNIGPGDGTGTVQFAEDGQTFYVTQADINLVHTPDLRNGPYVPYTQADLGMAEWGIEHSRAPINDNRAWSAIYRQCCTANSWDGQTLAARIMGTNRAVPPSVTSLWAHPAYFDYMDRYMAVIPSSRWLRSWDQFSVDMWDTYRVNY